MKRWREGGGKKTRKGKEKEKKRKRKTIEGEYKHRIKSG